MTEESQEPVVPVASLTPSMICKPGVPREVTQIRTELEYHQYIQKNPYACELLDPSRPIRMFFDAEEYFDTRPDSSATREYYQECMNQIQRIFPDMIPNKTIRTLYRKPRKVVKGNQTMWKLSYHFVLDKVVNLSDVKTFLQSHGLEQDKPFDLSVYKKNGLLNAPLCTKPQKIAVKEDEIPVLIPMDTSVPIMSYTVTFVDPSMDVSPLTPIKQLPPQAISPSPNADNMDDADEDKDVPFESLSKAVLLLDPIKRSKYQPWLYVVFAVCHVGVMNDYMEEAANLLHEFCKQMPNYNKFELDSKIFDTIKSDYKGKKLGYGSIRMWAKEDSPEEYAKVFAKYAGYEREAGLLIKYISVSKGSPSAINKDIVHCLLELDPYNQFNNLISDGEKLYKRIAPNIFEPLKGFAELNEYANRIHYEYRTWFCEMCSDLDILQRFLYFDNHLNDYRFIQTHLLFGLINHMKLFKPTFRTQIDTWRGVIPFQDGLYDIHERNLITTEDPFIPYTVYIPYNFKDIVATNHEEYEEFITSILSEPELREYVMSVFAHNLAGSHLKKFYFHYGPGGNNGKSSLFNFIKFATGNCYRTVNPNFVYTNNFQSASGHNNQMVDLKGGRIAVVAEIKSGKKGGKTIDISLIKVLTGGDATKGRGAFGKDDVEFIFTGGFHMFMNSLPSADEFDGGLNNRCCVIPYYNEFVDHPDPTRPRQKPKKDDVEKKYPEFIQAFFAEILDRVSRPVPPMPQVVRDATKIYLDEENPFSIVLDQLEKGTETDFVSYTEIRAIFDADNAANKAMKRTTFITMASKALGEMKEVHNYYDEHKRRKQKRCVFIGWRFNAVNENSDAE